MQSGGAGAIIPGQHSVSGPRCSHAEHSLSKLREVDFDGTTSVQGVWSSNKQQCEDVSAMRKKQGTSTGVGCLVLVGLLVVLAAISHLFEGNKDSPQQVTEPGPAAEVATMPAVVPAPQSRHAIGDDFSVGYWSYRCDRAIWQQYIVSGYSSIERPDAEFLIVDLVVQNNDRTSSTLPPLKLVDAQGREFDESSKGIFLDGSFGTLKQLNPGVSSRGLVVFDVPHREYTLKVSGGFESGKYGLVDLSSERKQGTGQEPPQASPLSEPAAPDNQAAPSNVASIRKAAQEGNANAQYDLGFVYDKGQGVPQDDAQAVFWYRKAAEQGDAFAQNNLASLYEQGRGVPQDYAQAYFWLALAASGKMEGVKPEETAKWRDDAASHLTAGELSQVQERVRKWLEEHPPKVD